VTTNLWKLPYGTLQPELVTPELFQPAVLEPNRWMGVSDFAPGRTGTLFVLQADGDRLEIDTDVVAWVRGLNGFSLTWTQTVVNGVTVAAPVWYYAVQEDGSDRSGLWSVELVRCNPEAAPPSSDR
jgi:hypothetical protein